MENVTYTKENVNVSLDIMEKIVRNTNLLVNQMTNVVEMTKENVKKMEIVAVNLDILVKIVLLKLQIVLKKKILA